MEGVEVLAIADEQIQVDVSIIDVEYVSNSLLQGWNLTSDPASFLIFPYLFHDLDEDALGIGVSLGERMRRRTSDMSIVSQQPVSPAMIPFEWMAVAFARLTYSRIAEMSHDCVAASHGCALFVLRTEVCSFRCAIDLGGVALEPAYSPAMAIDSRRGSETRQATRCPVTLVAAHTEQVAHICVSFADSF